MSVAAKKFTMTVNAQKPVILWGATGQARVLREILTHTGHRVLGVVDNNPDLPAPFDDVPLLYGAEELDRWLKRDVRSDTIGFIVAIGGANGRVRFDLHTSLRARGLVPVSAVHPTAFVAHNACLGEGVQILAQASVCVDAVLGDCCIVNTGASVDHESVLGQGVHVAPGATVAGCVEIGDFAMIGLGAKVLPWLKIGEGAVVGAGAVVVKDVAPNSVVVGVPATPMGTLESVPES